MFGVKFLNDKFAIVKIKHLPIFFVVIRNTIPFVGGYIQAVICEDSGSDATIGKLLL